MLRFTGRLLTFVSSSFEADDGRSVPFHRATLTAEDGSVLLVKVPDELAKIVHRSPGRLRRYGLAEVAGVLDTYSDKGVTKPCLRATALATVEESTGEVQPVGAVAVSTSDRSFDVLADDLEVPAYDHNGA